MNLLSIKIEQKIKHRINCKVLQNEYDLAIKNITKIIDELHANIPDQKRISYGRVHTIKCLSEYLFRSLSKNNAPIFQIGSKVFEKGMEYKSRSAALGILSHIGLKDYESVLPFFESAAIDENCDVREMSQMFFKKVIKKYPDQMKNYLLNLANSTNPIIRRFVAETLRPVQENRWFYKDPDYPLSILKYLFKENTSYPRTSVGNNLSDLTRHLPHLVYDLVKELVENGDKNSYWIAYRACRNLVNKDLIKVMDLLKIDEYKYKNRIYRRSDYQGN